MVRLALLCLGVASAFQLPAPRRALETRKDAASIAEELGAVQRVDTTMDPIKRNIERFTTDIEAVDEDMDQFEPIKSTQAAILNTAVAWAAVMALAPTSIVPLHLATTSIVAGTCVTDAIGSYEEWQCSSARANAREIAAISTRAAAEAEEIVCGAVRVKSLLPVCVLVSVAALNLSLLTNKALELAVPEEGESASIASYASPGLAKVMSWTLPTLPDPGSAAPAAADGAAAAAPAAATLPGWQLLFGSPARPELASPMESAPMEREAAASVKTLILLACPVVSLLTASVAVLAEQDASRRALRAQALGRRRFATKADIGRTWKSVTEIVEIESKADTDAWTGFVRAFLPAPLIAGAVASLSESSGQDAAVLASIVATAWGGFQVAVSFVACEYNLARGEESVAAKSRNAGIAEAYSAQAGKANAQVPYAHAISVLCVGTAALLVEAVPKILALPLPFISYAAVRRAAKYRSRTRGDAAAVAASADQLAGLQDGSDDDPLLPLKLTWQNFRGTVSATKKVFLAEVRVQRLRLARWLTGGKE